MTAACGWCIGPEGALRAHCNGTRCTSCECNPISGRVSVPHHSGPARSSKEA